MRPPQSGGGAKYKAPSLSSLFLDRNIISVSFSWPSSTTHQSSEYTKQKSLCEVGGPPNYTPGHRRSSALRRADDIKYSGEIRQAAVKASNTLAFGEQVTRLLSSAGATGITMSIAFAKQSLADTRGASTPICAKNKKTLSASIGFHRAHMRATGA